MPLYKKLEQDFENNYLLPEINENKMKLEQYKKLKGRHFSLKELKVHQIEHDKIMKKRLKELMQQRNYKQKYPAIKIPKSPWIESIKQAEKEKKEKAMSAASSSGKFSNYANLGQKLKISRSSKNAITKRAMKPKHKGNVYKMAKVKGKTVLNLKTKDSKTVVVEPNNNDEILAEHFNQEDSGAVNFPSTKPVTQSVRQQKLKKVINMNKKVENPSSETSKKPPKVPLKVHLPKLKNSRNKNIGKTVKSLQNTKENIKKTKKPVRDYLKEMRQKRKERRCNSEQKEANSSYKEYYNWDLDLADNKK